MTIKKAPLAKVKSSPTQRQLAAMYIRAINNHFAISEEVDYDLYELKGKLAKILADAQNAPPNGGSDGSINAKDYARLWTVSNALEALYVSLRPF